MSALWSVVVASGQKMKLALLCPWWVWLRTLFSFLGSLGSGLLFGFGLRHVGWCAFIMYVVLRVELLA